MRNVAELYALLPQATRKILPDLKFSDDDTTATLEAIDRAVLRALSKDSTSSLATRTRQVKSGAMSLSEI